MNVRFDGETVDAGREARERFYDSRGYGHPRGEDLVLTPVETAHLLYRGDIDTVYDERDGSQRSFRGFLGLEAVSEVDFFVYKDLRDRGFYLSPTTETDGETEFEVYPRGQGPWDDEIAYRITAVSERTDITATRLQSVAGMETTGVLAVVDEESEVTYLEIDEPKVSGSADHKLPNVDGELLADRVIVWEPPSVLHQRAFYGQRLDQAGDPVQLSLVEAAYLETEGVLSLDSNSSSGTTIEERGRSVEGDRFDRRFRVYSALRELAVVPKTGFKFGADFRTYADVEDIDNLGHSELLVRVLDASHTFEPRDLALDVRLAHGVRKTMVFGLVGEDIDWLAVTRLTP